MSEEPHEEESAEEEHEAQAQSEAPEPPAHAEAEPPASADSDPIAIDAGEDAPGLFARLNPMRMFRKHSVERFINDGKDLLENGSLAQATVAFHKALQLDAKCVPALRGLGKVFYKKGGRSNFETALKHYQDAIRLAPMEHDLYAITAKIYDALGKRKEATLERKKFVIVRALDSDPRNPVANNNMGILFLQQGRMDDALAYFNNAIGADRHYDVAHRNLAAAYFQLAKNAPSDDKKGEYNTKAREAIENALKIAPSPPTLMAHARIQMMDGSLEEVLATLEKVDTMLPANPDVYFMKKMALEGLGRFDEAKDAHNSYLMFRSQAAEPAAEAAAE